MKDINFNENVSESLQEGIKAVDLAFVDGKPQCL